MSNIVPYEEKRTLAASLVKSNLFGIKDESQALALMAICEAEGMHPAKAVQTFHIIQGRPAIKADALLARFQEAGGKVNWTQYTDDKVVGTFTHPAGGSITVDWDIARAKRIGLASKDNWRNYPRNMLRARCISEGVRAVFPGIATGIYTVEEVTDMPAAQAKNMGAVEIVTPPSELLDKACAAADQGMAAYAAFFKALTSAERVSLKPEHETLKLRAQDADKPTADADGVIEG